MMARGRQDTLCKIGPPLLHRLAFVHCWLFSDLGECLDYIVYSNHWLATAEVSDRWPQVYRA